jgi:hypothetical protein
MGLALAVMGGEPGGEAMVGESGIGNGSAARCEEGGGSRAVVMVVVVVAAGDESRQHGEGVSVRARSWGHCGLHARGSKGTTWTWMWTWTCGPGGRWVAMDMAK